MKKVEQKAIVMNEIKAQIEKMKEMDLKMQVYPQIKVDYDNAMKRWTMALHKASAKNEIALHLEILTFDEWQKNNDLIYILY